MSIEEEVRGFVSLHVRNGAHYLTSVPVLAFGRRTWVEVWAAGDVPERVQRKVLQQLRDTHGKRSSF